MKVARSILVYLLLVVTGVILASGLAEVWLRLTHYGEAGKIRLTGFMQYDRILGWRHIPNVTSVWTTPEYHVTVHYNAAGWRDSDHKYQKTPNTSRIIVLGDSFGEGLGVQAQDRFSDVMQASLGSRFEVVNLAVAAYSTDQKLLVLENDGWKYQPDFVVLEMDFNDVWGNGLPSTSMVMGTEKPVFVVNDSGELKLTNVPVPPPRIQAKGPRSMLYDLLRRTVGTQKLDWQPASGAPRTLPETFQTYSKTESAQLKNAWAVTKALLHRMQEETEQHHARLIVLYVPSRVELSEKEWHSWPFSADQEPRHVADKIMAICSAEGIECMDPSRSFKDAGRQKRLYYEADLHWNAEGHHLAGKLLADHIQGFLRSAARR